jgi:predicted MPP superfamily phosphohydrolase
MRRFLAGIDRFDLSSCHKPQVLELARANHWGCVLSHGGDTDPLLQKWMARFFPASTLIPLS